MGNPRTSRFLLAAASPIGVATILVAGSATGAAATVLTLEGGIVGMQPWFHFTPQNLRGEYCTGSYSCRPVDYFAFPTGPFTQRGGELVSDEIAGIHADNNDEDIVLLGHSQGGQVIYSALRDWSSGALPAPDPEHVTWVSTGNPENKYGGTMGGIGYTNGEGLPADLDYDGIEVIRQYDGWADEPDDAGNILAVINAYIGRQTLHTAYEDVNLHDPKNVTKTEYYCDEGVASCDATNAKSKVTYVWVPTETLPLVAWTGPFAPALDNMLRPIVDKAYTGRPAIPDPTPPAAESNTTAARTEVKAAELKNADLSVSSTSTKLSGDTKDSSGQANRQANRSAASVRPVRDAIASIKKTLDRVTDKIAERVSQMINAADGETAEAAS
jgi:hypothetical protein